MARLSEGVTASQTTWWWEGRGEWIGCWLLQNSGGRFDHFLSVVQTSTGYGKRAGVRLLPPHRDPRLEEQGCDGVETTYLVFFHGS